MPNFFNKVGSRFSDFPKRICALRELFEETNLLFSRRDPEAEKAQIFEEPLLSNYN
jgi:8-oxo-dGTP pyrophosphatase MutT (NUDIX family)